MQCEVCKGTGKQILTVYEFGMSPSETPIDCIWCEGTGEMTEEQADDYLDYVTCWCRCEIPGHPYFVEDTPEMKHHWNCSQCHKVLQFG